MPGSPRKSTLKKGFAAPSDCLVVVCLLATCSTVLAQTAVSKAVGTVKSVNANSIVLTSDAGTETTVTFTDSARIVRASPGQTDLRSAPSIQISDIQVGDRVAARGQAEDGGGLTASVAIVMKQGDIAQRQQAEREEWRRGVGGIVKDVHASVGTITVVNLLVAGGKAIVIHASPSTEVKRYAPNSVKFDDAKAATLDQIKAGDQVRARGTRNADGTEFTAQAIVSGSFRDIAGTVISTNAVGNSITISDLLTKKPVTVKVGADSQLRKLPQFVAMRFAARLKGDASGGSGPGGTGAEPTGQPPSGVAGAGNWHGRGEAGGPTGPGGNAPRGNGNGPQDFQQLLARMPALSIPDLNKGDAVILVATEGEGGSEPTVITLLSGVEPILSAAPAGTSAATILSPWNLGEPAGGGGEAAAQ